MQRLALLPTSDAGLARKLVPFREALVRVDGGYGQIRWSRWQDRDVDVIRVQFRPLDGDPANPSPFRRASSFDGAPAADAVVSKADGRVRVEAPEGPLGALLAAEVAAGVAAEHPGIRVPAAGGARFEEVAPDELVWELLEARRAVAAVEARLGPLCDERNLLRERIVRLTAGCAALGAAVAVLLGLFAG